MSCKVTIIDTYEKAMEKHYLLRRMLRSVIAEVDEISYKQNSIIETKYNICFKEEIEEKEKLEDERRKIESQIALIQKYHSNGLEILEDDINEELEKLEAKISEERKQRDFMKGLHKYHYDYYTEHYEEYCELNVMYRHNIKFLHADLFTNTREADIMVWDSVLQAYCENDVGSMRGLYKTMDSVYELSSDMPMDVLTEYNNVYSLKFEELSRVLAVMKSQFPYCLKNQLESTRWIELKRVKLREDLSILKGNIENLKVMLNALKNNRVQYK